MSTAAQELAVATRKVAVPFQPDGGPARHRIGLIALSTDMATERDFQHMLPDDVMFSTARVISANPVTDENLRKIGPHLAQAAALLLPDMRLDVIAYSCTSGSVALGYDEVAAQIHQGRPDVPVVTPITSAIAGMKMLGVARISLLTPYIDSVNQSMRRFLEAHGISVLNIGAFCLESDVDMAELAPQAIHEAALETCRDDADALFISCTAIRAVEIIERTEQALGKPVLSAIQTLFWQSLRESGYSEPVGGFGSLLRR